MVVPGHRRDNAAWKNLWLIVAAQYHDTSRPGLGTNDLSINNLHPAVSKQFGSGIVCLVGSWAAVLPVSAVSIYVRVGGEVNSFVIILDDFARISFVSYRADCTHKLSPS
jgi:hypothetical protein